MTRAEIQKLPRAFADVIRERRRRLKKVKRPQPRHRAKRDFQTARPVNPELRRVRVHPCLEMRRERARVSLIARQPVSLTERHEILMPVQLPDDLLVTGDFSVEIVELAPVQQRNALSGQRLNLPIDRIAKAEVLEPKQIKLARTDSIGFLDQRLRSRRKAGSKRSNGCFGILKTREETRFGAGAKVFEQMIGDRRLIECKQRSERFIGREFDEWRPATSLAESRHPLRGPHAQLVKTRVLKLLQFHRIDLFLRVCY